MMVKKKKKQSRSESSAEKTLDPKLPSIFNSKLASGKDMKHMMRGMSSKPAHELSSQSRVVRCPKCHKFLQEPVDVTIYRCSGCNSILLAKRWDNDKDLLSSQNRSFSSTEVESAEDSGSKTPVRNSYRKFSSRASPCFERRGYHSETAYRRRHETSYIPREWMRKADEFSATGDFASARSCSGVAKLCSTKTEDTTLLDLLRFSNSGTCFAEETVAVVDHQDSASDSHLSSSDKGIKEDIRSKFYDLKLEAFQPSLEQSEEESAEGGGGSKTPVRSSYRKYSSRASPLFETSHRRRHETTSSYIRREWTRSASPSPSYGYTSSPFQWSQFSSAAASPIRSQGETSSNQKCYQWSSQQSQMLHDSQYHNLHSWSGVLELSSVAKKDKEGDVVIRRSVSSEFYELKPEVFQPQWNHKSSEATGETSGIHLEQAHGVEPLLSEKYTRDMQEFDWGGLKWDDMMGDKGDSICESSSSNGEMYEDTKHISSNQSFIENPNESGEATVTIYMTHEEQSKHENISERQELDKNISDRVMRYELEDARLGTVYAGERRREEETMEDRVGLHLEEYETNYENYSNPFEWNSVEAQGRSESSSRGSLGDHESFKENLLGQEEENKIEELKVGVMVEDVPSLHVDKCGYESTTTLEETFGLTEASTPIFCQHEPELGTLLEPDNEEAGDGSSESSTSTGSFNSHESSKLRAVFQQEEPQVVMSDSRSEMISVKLEDIFEWTSERAPTFHLYEPELGALLEDACERSESSSRGSFNDHVIPKEREMMDHGEDSRLVTDEDKHWIVDAYETKALKLEDRASLDLETFENEKLLLDQSREDMFRLSLEDTLEQELEISQDKEVNLRQTFKKGDTEENMVASGSMVSSQGHEPRSITAEVESEAEAEEEILRDHFKNLQKETIVGLRHALYQTTQTSPLSSPIHTPIGSSSPLHIQMRSSSMNSHIVSPLRSPTNSSGSLSDVLFLAKKT